MADLSSAIETAASQPRRMSVDGQGSAEQHSLAELAEADRYLAAKAAGTRRNKGVRFQKIVAPGT
jgi:hypothetical protein